MARAAQNLRRLLVLPVVVGVLAGCGADEPPSEAAPELADALSAVDDALSNRNFARAEKALDRLAAEAEEAEQDGKISEAQADEIVDAAEDLIARLPDAPDVEPSDDPTTPTPSDTPPPQDEGRGDEEGGEGDEKDKEKDEKEDKGDKGEGDKGKGNGD